MGRSPRATARHQPRAEAIYRRTATVNMAELTILLLVIVAMTTKPG